MDALGHLSPFPKGTVCTFILSPSRSTDPIKIKAKAPNPHLQDSNALSPNFSQDRKKTTLRCPCSPSNLILFQTSSSGQLYTLRSTPLPQPCNFHKSDTFTPTPPSFSAQVSYPTNSVASPTPKTCSIQSYCFFLASEKWILTTKQIP